MPAAGPGGHPRAPETPRDARADKAALRSRLRAARASAPESPSDAAARARRCLDACAGHAVVATYASVAGEPDTWRLLEGLVARGTRVLLPLLAGRRTPAWSWYTGPDAVRPGWHGIPEPTGPSLGPEGLAAATFVWASALAVTPSGHRLGAGGGWFDRALAWAAPDAPVGVLVADAEVLPAVPLDPWDHHIDVIATPTRTLWCRGSAAE